MKMYAKIVLLEILRLRTLWLDNATSYNNITLFFFAIIINEIKLKKDCIYKKKCMITVRRWRVCHQLGMIRSGSFFVGKDQTVIPRMASLASREWAQSSNVTLSRFLETPRFVEGVQEIECCRLMSISYSLISYLVRIFRNKDNSYIIKNIVTLIV